MIDKIQIISVTANFVLLIVIFYLIRTRRLRIQYSVLWLITAFFLLVLSFWRSLLEKMAQYLDIFYPPALLFLMGFLFSLVIILHFSVVVSRLSEMNKELAQRLSILTWKMEELEKAKSKRNED